MGTAKIYVELVGEQVQVWAPVEAIEVAESVFRLPLEAPEDQVWAFPPGSLVVCERRDQALFAVAAA